MVQDRSREKVYVGFLVKLVSGPPHGVPEHEVVFVLPTAVVTVRIHGGSICFSGSRIAEEVMCVADDFVAPLAW